MTIMERWTAVKTGILFQMKRVEGCRNEAAKIIQEKTGQKYDREYREGDFYRTVISIGDYKIIPSENNWRLSGEKIYLVSDTHTVEHHWDCSLSKAEEVLEKIEKLQTGDFISYWESLQK